MEPKKISAELSVIPQTAAADMPAIKAAGFRAVICNRPDGEGADQPSPAQRSIEEIDYAAWFLKEKLLPPVYWKGMLRGKEWMISPEKVLVK